MKKIISFFLTLVMFCSCFVGLGIQAGAANVTSTDFSAKLAQEKISLILLVLRQKIDYSQNNDFILIDLCINNC